MRMIDIMHFATVKRMAAGILLVGGALLFTPTTALAQSANPAYVPLAEIALDIAPPVSNAGTSDAGTSNEITRDKPASEAVTSTHAELTHVIAVGDTLSNIAQRYGVELTSLAAYNQILDFNHVIIGQKLWIPPAGVNIAAPTMAIVPGAGVPGAGGYHVVRQGESLSVLARRYGLTLEELLALNEIDNANLVRMGTMLRLTADVEPPTAPLASESTVVTYVVQRGDTLSEIAQAHGTSTGQIMQDNGLMDTDVREGQTLQISPAASALAAFGVDAPADGERRIVIDLSDQTLTAYQGDVVVLSAYVSTGKDATPTREGEYAIYQKLNSQHMTGEDYDLPGVPWVMYYDDEFAIHGAYWHANFGIPTSHGCINMTIPESRALYSWAPLGTRVSVQW